ncbi:glycoside hydrolase family 3 N-terminal domain-containing protein [Roseovarius sp. S1116L3]|uniref:glycoside hydrolase family 3 N-terminal domain-containing protein n=1 Tax=Roseovarius roseus TaxID=3342636 RepID=UPI00372A458F
MINRRKFIAATGSWGALGIGSPSFAHSDPDKLPGKFLVTGFRGTHPSDREVVQLRRYIENGEVAGVMLLRRNIESPEQLNRLNASLQSAATEHPVIICIDQEGGQVTRLGSYNGFMPWMSAADLAGSGRNDMDILGYYAQRADELSAVGVNLNLAPVVDLNVNPFNPVIGAKGRAYGRHVADVVRFAELFIRAHRSAGVRTCLKHFPGHGSSIDDSHVGSADISETWSPEEISPFERLVRAGLADTIMNAHVLHRHLSDSPWIPTSLSERSVDEIRYGLNFTGPIISDDMQMGAITNLISPIDASVAAIRAGNSLLIYSNFENMYSIRSIVEVNERLIRAMKDEELNMDDVVAGAEKAEAFRASLVNPL